LLCPSESTIRRLLGKIDADGLDAVIGAFVQRLCTDSAAAGRRRVLAVDGKALRGSRHSDREGAEMAGRRPRQSQMVLSRCTGWRASSRDAGSAAVMVVAPAPR
jgi:hypothetical protein